MGICFKITNNIMEKEPEVCPECGDVYNNGTQRCDFCWADRFGLALFS